MSCSKAKIGYYSKGKIYSDNQLQSEIPDAISDYNSNTADNKKGLIIHDENHVPNYFQINLNIEIKDLCNALLNAFDISAVPTTAYEIELQTKLVIFKNIVNNILDNIP